MAEDVGTHLSKHVHGPVATRAAPLQYAALFASCPIIAAYTQAPSLVTSARVPILFKVAGAGAQLPSRLHSDDTTGVKYQCTNPLTLLAIECPQKTCLHELELCGLAAEPGRGHVTEHAFAS